MRGGDEPFVYRNNDGIDYDEDTYTRGRVTPHKYSPPSSSMYKYKYNDEGGGTRSL